jgi:pimeloyl-ACP methyl ester carboxylesterase
MKIRSTAILVSGIASFLISCSFSPDNNPKVMKMQHEVKGKGRPLVLVGGGLTGWASWEPFVDGFAENHTVIRVQLLGVQWGLENHPLPKDYSIKTESMALAATLDSLGFTGPVDLVAWSYGAFTSLDFALDYPENIHTLTLIEPPALWVLRETGNWDNDTQESADFFETQQGDIPEEMLAEFLQRAGLVPPGQTASELPQWNNWVPFRNSLRVNPSIVSFRDELHRLNNFQPPVLLIKGTGSTTYLHQIIDDLAANLPHSQVKEFPGGHAPHLVSKADFLEALEAFHNQFNLDYN